MTDNERAQNLYEKIMETRKSENSKQRRELRLKRIKEYSLQFRKLK